VLVVVWLHRPMSIHAQGLSKRYGAHVALHALDLVVGRGSVFGLLGPNGAGKTTTLRMMATLLTPTHGTVLMDGLDVRTHDVEVRARVGIVNGGMKVPERLTGLETLTFFGRMNHMNEALVRERSAWVCELLKIDAAVLRKQAREMSTGMQQKLVVARAILHQPPVLLLDEATAGLDLFARRALLDFVHGYQSPTTTIVYSTHIMAEAQELCSDVGFVHEGRLLVHTSNADACARGDGSLERAFFRAIEAQREQPAQSASITEVA
jgi:sodium transport system ATP-binding protein